MRYSKIVRLSALPHAPILLAERQAFRALIGESGHAKFEAAAGMHDDLVLAVALWRLQFCQTSQHLLSWRSAVRPSWVKCDDSDSARLWSAPLTKADEPRGETNRAFVPQAAPEYVPVVVEPSFGTCCAHFELSLHLASSGAITRCFDLTCLLC